MSDADTPFMRRAIRLAMNGRGRAEPNPLVGCVIVRDGRVIGEGYHEQYGQPHAEPNALAACTESPAGATAYVTLEPCCHTHKQTPPCVPRLIEAKVARVVVGCTDPNPAVDGRGIAMLRAGGVRVDTGVLEGECKQLIAPFVARVVHKRPYVTLKWAQTADGNVAGPGGVRLQISNDASMRLVHQLRARSDSILVGIRTVLADDPMLTARGVDFARPIRRYVLDRDLAIPETSRLVTTADDTPVSIFCSEVALRLNPGKVGMLTAFGVQLIGLKETDGRHLALADVLLGGHAAEMGTHLLVEPGPGLAGGFVADGLWDRCWIFCSPRDLNDPHAPRAVPFGYESSGEIELGGDMLTEYLNPRSRVFFADEPSADLVLGGLRL